LNSGANTDSTGIRSLSFDVAKWFLGVLWNVLAQLLAADCCGFPEPQ
jgi:hypothetical protein